MRDGYNRVEVKGKEMFYMEAVVKDMNVVEDRTAMENIIFLISIKELMIWKQGGFIPLMMHFRLSEIG